MADTAEEARRHARTMREIKLYGVADAMDNYAALLEAMTIVGSHYPALVKEIQRIAGEKQKADNG